ncbi:MAG TPA: SBBP repeat-containing protein, partial [Archangium sp.]|nr:SBBP repeat-containing protein [Archangium sp.]
MDRNETRKRRLDRSATLLLALGVAGWLGQARAAHTEAPTWSRLLGTSGHDQAVGAAASLEAVYVAGYTAGALPTNTSAGGFDAWVARYGTDGTLAWARQLGTASNEYVTGLAHHDAQAVALFVTGYTGGALPGNVSAGGQDAFLARYDASGALQWVRQLGSSEADFSQAVATDAAGNAYVAGYTSGTLAGQTSSGKQDLFLAKYDGAGNRLWARQAGTNGTDVAQAVATSRRPSGEVDVYLVGRTTGGTDGRGLDGQPQRGGYDWVVLRYDAAG